MEVTTAVIVGGATILAGLLALVGVLAGVFNARLNEVADDLGKQRAYNRVLWRHNRALTDLYYRHRQPGAPEPPELPTEPD